MVVALNQSLVKSRSRSGVAVFGLVLLVCCSARSLRHPFGAGLDSRQASSSTLPEGRAQAHRERAAAPGKVARNAEDAVASPERPVEDLHRRVLSRYPASPPDPAREAVFHEFDEWLRSYLSRPTVPTNQEDDNLSVGLMWVNRRRVVLEELIRRDPERALELSLSPWVANRLPEQVGSRLERVVDARGDLEVLAALPAPGKEAEVPRVSRLVRVGDETFQAYVFGRRLEESTRRRIPIHGIAVGLTLAVDEHAIRLLSAREMEERSGVPLDAVCSLSGATLKSGSGAVMVSEGDRDVVLCGVEHARVFDDTLVGQEAETDTNGIAKASLGANSWTLGEKKLLLVRVDFSDLTGAPFSDSAGTNLVIGLREFYGESSCNKASFALIGAGSAMTPTLRMPAASSFYGTNNNASKLRSDARVAAKAAGYDLSRYQLDLVCLGNVSGFGWAGLGVVGSAGAWMRGPASLGVAAHELGHNFGLNHANFWETSGLSIIGKGSEVEYGDKFDTMGSANAGVKHFNARYKNYLNWLGAADVTSVTFNGKYRLFAQDLSQSTGVRALKIARGSTTNYWVEFRQRYTSNPWLMDGVGLRWGRAANQSTQLLDATPGSVDGKDDSPLMVGRTFSDRDAGVHITVLGKGGTSPESMDVAVYRGFFVGNRSPEVTVASATIQTTVGTEIRLAVSASDPDGDELAYGWEFGDKGTGSNEAGALHTWTAAGDYQARVSVSDMRGGVTVKSMSVRVGNPGTFKVSGKVILDGRPLAGVLVAATSSKTALTDSDGAYHLVGLTASTYTIKARLEGYSFELDGFTNPLRISSNVTGVNFHAIPPLDLRDVALVPMGAVWHYLDDGSDQGTAWREASYNDSGWREGPAELGYGDTDVATVIRYGPNSNNKHITTYFRHSFEVEDPAVYTSATMELVRDDGAVVYLNGAEVFRSNMPAGNIRTATRASSTVSGTDEIASFDEVFNPSLLKRGGNVLAVELHQSSPTSSDVRFDLRVVAASLAREQSPKLSVQRSFPGVEIAWPGMSGGWRLFSASGLGEPAVWRAVDGAPQSSTADNRFRVPESTGTVFFQLRR